MKFEKGKVFVASELVDYVEGGVISKELVHNNAGSVTLFSFDAGQSLSEHLAPFDALIQVVGRRDDPQCRRHRPSHQGRREFRHP